MKALIICCREAALLWYDKDADHMAATVSYYSLFAVAPLILLSVTVLGLIYGKEFVIGVLHDWGSVLGPDVLELLHKATANLSVVTDSFGIPFFGIIFFSGMVIVSLNTFTSGLHRLWSIPHQGVMGWCKKSVRSMGFVIILEVYLIVLVGLGFLSRALFPAMEHILINASLTLFFVLATALLFNLMYWILPWEPPQLRARLCGALVSSVLFTIAKWAVALYASTTPVPGLFGAAGLMIVFLTWVYATVAILYYGAALAHCYDKQ